jgi:dephospho-CoA kinase
MIIHILGTTGVGKTELGKKISTQFNIDVIETDDIHHRNVLKIASKYKLDISEIEIEIEKVREHTLVNLWHFCQKKLFKEFDSELLNINQEELNNKLVNYKDKNLIITGGLHNMIINTDIHYSIKIDRETHYKQFMIRTLNGIYENYEGILEILNSDISLYKKQFIIAITYKVPSGFISNYDKWKQSFVDDEKHANRSGYIYATPIEITNDIAELLIK